MTVLAKVDVPQQSLLRYERTLVASTFFKKAQRDGVGGWGCLHLSVARIDVVTCTDQSWSLVPFLVP